MAETTMHKHVGNQLVGLKPRRKKVVEAQQAIETYALRDVEGNGGQKHQPVYYEQIFYYRRQYLKTLCAKILHLFESFL